MNAQPKLPESARGLRFARMHGCGNDFVVIDDRAGLWHAQREKLAQELCDRRKGLGGDGLILIERGEGGANFRMSYTNRTGMDGEMCGNGARCTVLRAAELGLFDGKAAMATDAGLIRATIAGRFVTLSMTPPVDERPATEMTLAVGNVTGWYIDTGVPHVVVFLESVAALEAFDVTSVGRDIRYHSAFERGANANFAARLADGSFRMRTYERGVEMETLACGSGAVAVGLIAHRRFASASPVVIHPTGGGKLEIGFRAAGAAFADVTLSGPAETIAEGEITVEWLAARGLTPASLG
jgi:diaminopimelate epimerase